MLEWSASPLEPLRQIDNERFAFFRFGLIFVSVWSLAIEVPIASSRLRRAVRSNDNPSWLSSSPH
jgi:hypothetical protein